jgi:hypothetical protein
MDKSYLFIVSRTLIKRLTAYEENVHMYGVGTRILRVIHIIVVVLVRLSSLGNQ